eukprot:9665319-Lingulodinium_polyedra.AAC.1
MAICPLLTDWTEGDIFELGREPTNPYNPHKRHEEEEHRVFVLGTAACHVVPLRVAARSLNGPQ